MPIYTKTGDKGETSLFGGVRVSKSSEQVEAYGSVDELNCWIGLIIAELEHQQKKELLQKIQTDLFVIGGNLAGWKSDLSELQTRVTEMEVEIDAMESSLQSLTNFILPGGTMLASRIHLARSVCRRVERQIVKIRNSNFEIDEIIIQYLNRFSDLLFVLARFINKAYGVEDVVWTSGITRKS